MVERFIQEYAQYEVRSASARISELFDEVDPERSAESPFLCNFFRAYATWTFWQHFAGTSDPLFIEAQSELFLLQLWVRKFGLPYRNERCDESFIDTISHVRRWRRLKKPRTEQQLKIWRQERERQHRQFCQIADEVVAQAKPADMQNAIWEYRQRHLGRLEWFVARLMTKQFMEWTPNKKLSRKAQEIKDYIDAHPNQKSDTIAAALECSDVWVRELFRLELRPLGYRSSATGADGYCPPDDAVKNT